MLKRTAPFYFSLLLLMLFSVESEAQSLFPIKKNNKWGLINAEGRIVKRPEYQAIGEFKDFGYATMQKKGKVGMLNSRGMEIVPAQYEDVKALDSLLISVFENGEWKVIDLNGQVIVPAGYDEVKVLAPVSETVSDGYLAFSKKKKWGIVNGKGKLVTAPKYDAIVVFNDFPEGVTGLVFQVTKNKLLGLLLPNGQELIRPSVEDIRVYNSELIFFKKDLRWGAVDHTGQELLPPRYNRFSRLSEKFVKLVANNQEYIFSLVYNKLVTQETFEAIYPFSEDYVLCKRNRLLGLLDHCGSIVLTPKYDEIQPYDGDIFRANLGGRWGIVTIDDQALIRFQFDYIAPMRSGLCVVIRNGQLGVANNRGEVVVSPDFERIELEEKKAKAFRNNKLTLFNFNNEGRLEDKNSFGKHFKIKISRPDQGRLPDFDLVDSPYQLEKFEWFYSPKHDKWGLRRLDNGKVQIEPSFHEVQVERELGLTLVGVEMQPRAVFDRTKYRFEMAYGLVQNDTGLLVHEVDLLDVRLSDFDAGMPVARCIFTNGKHGLVNRIGKIIRKDLAYIGRFRDGMARMTPKGKMTVTTDRKANHLGLLRGHLEAQLAPVTLTDYTQHDLNVDRFGYLTCEDCKWGYLDTLGEMSVAPNYTFARDFVNEVGIVADGIKWGMIDKEGKTLLPCRYDGLAFLENTDQKILRIYKEEQKYGLIDTLGRIAVGVQYDEIGSFNEGRLAVKLHGHWGFADANGREVVPCRFDEVGLFSEGLAAVRIGNKWGYIDKQGNVILRIQFSKAGEFHNGLAPAKKEGPRFGYIDKKGKWALAPAYRKAFAFDRGVARVMEISGDVYRWGLIDTAGNFLVKPKFLSISPFDQFGLSVVGVGGNPTKYGLMNLQGLLVTSQPFRTIEPFSEGLAKVQGRNGYGFINMSGRTVIPTKFSKASNFVEGRAAVWVDGRCGFIDIDGNMVVEPQFSRCMDFREGKAIVFKGNQRAGLIDTEGNLLIEPGINQLLDFAEGRGLVRDEHYKFYYITENARFYDGKYEKAGKFRHGVAVVQIEGRWAIINQQGIEVIPPKYDKIEQFENGYAKVGIKGFSGLTNLQGEMIVQPDYEYISYAGEGLFRVEQGDKVGYFDAEGNWVWGLQE